MVALCGLAAEVAHVDTPVMPARNSTTTAFEPRYPGTLGALVCTLAALTLLWPLLTGQILFGGGRSDMFIAGYAFRLFGATTFKATGAIPQWNPYLFGGLPYIAAMHGDIFYPTAWMRWIMPVDLAITWGMAIHFVLAGWLTYGFARALGLSWGAAVTAGVGYELSGIVASQMSPGHDGKLFVSALTPLAFWLLLRAIRQGQRWAFGAFSFVVALTVLGHYNMSYFLLIALALWTLYLAFWDTERETGANPWQCIFLAGVAVVIGIGIGALQLIPFLQYIKYSPRADGGPDTGWAFATSYAFPPREIFTTILPQFNGVLGKYWGQNPIKFHTEYIGLLPLALAALAWGDRTRRRLVSVLLIGAGVFLLFSFAGYTPFYRLLFGVLPYLSKIRAMGMVFFLVAFPVSLLAGIGFDRVLSRSVSPRTVLFVVGGFGVFALLGVLGGLQAVAEALAIPERAAEVQANAPDLRLGALRLLVFVTLGGAVLFGIATARINARIGVVLGILLMVGDLWTVDRQFFQFSPRAAQLFAPDAVTSRLQATPLPYRALEAGSSYGHSVLMAYHVPVALGYHGNELESYRELGDAANGWRSIFDPHIVDLLAIRFLILDRAQPVPGFHTVAGPVVTSLGTTAVLYEKDTVPPYARVVATAAKIPQEQIVTTLVDPRFPVAEAVLFPDSSSVRVDPVTQPLPIALTRATVTQWSAGHMTVSLTGSDPKPTHLLISENWYPDWRGTVDGKPAIVRRADASLLSVDLPPGAREVRLWFDSPAYATGKVVSAIALALALLMMIVPVAQERRRMHATARPAAA